MCRWWRTWRTCGASASCSASAKRAEAAAAARDQHVQVEHAEGAAGMPDSASAELQPQMQGHEHANGGITADTAGNERAPPQITRPVQAVSAALEQDSTGGHISSDV